MGLILTLTLNPAIDRNVQADRLVFEDRAYILSTGETPGGRGINASIVLHAFNAPTKAIACSGGKAGKRFEELLADSGFPTIFVRIRHSIRGNLTIVDKQGLAVKLNERGPHIQAAELARFERTVAENLDGAGWLMICGSLPPGVPADFYGRLIHLAQKAKVKTLLDTDGDALLHGLEAGPTAVAPNQAEAERLLNRALITQAHFREAAQRIAAMGAESVIMSLGSRGAVGAIGTRIVEAIPPVIDAVCPIGAGDALAAAFVWALADNQSFDDAVRWGVACGTASAALPGIAFPTLSQTEKMFARVETRIISA
ncbi:MAG: 1-phosphofructokinase family hexose kinase [Acidobacteria bacterium]|nr:1-phosphofructokinase family hexose kinase [Acidobacteriota bacterium]